MAFASWSSLRNWFSDSARAAHRRRGSTHPPRLEALEDRTLLSPGDLDPTFGNGGLVVTPPPSPVYGLAAQRVVVQPDGRILTAAVESYFKGTPPPELIRYNPDGSLDTSFGSNGIVYFPLEVFAGPFPMALQSDGRIVVAHYGRAGLDLARYDSDGRLDNSFGSGGTVTTSFRGYTVTPSSVAVQPDGSIIFGGGAIDGNGSSFSLVRYSSRGVLDTRFGNQGLVVTAFPGHSSAHATGLAFQEDGSIVLAGTTALTSAGPAQIGLARYDHDGHLDPSFGAGGLVTTSFPGFANASAGNDLALLSDGRILLAGSVSNATVYSGRFGLARYDSDGSLDTSFGTGGLVTTAFPGFPGADGYGMTVQPDGRILVAGGAYPSSASEQFGLARYDSDGSLDTSFGTGGLVTTAFPRATYAEAATVTVQPDGRIVAAGRAGGNAVARYEGDGLAATHFEVSAPATVTAGQPFEVTVTAVDDSGEVVPDYAGTVTLTSTDPQAPDLGSHTFTTADGGVFTFTGVQLFTAGQQSLFVDDGSLIGQADLVVDPGQAVALLLSGPDQATAGQAFVVTLTAYDAYGNVATGYRGSVSFVSTDPAAQLPVDYAFSTDDAGSHDFTITLNTPGPVRLTAIDTFALTLGYLDLTVS